MVLRLIRSLALASLLTGCIRPGPPPVIELPAEQAAPVKRDYERPLPAGAHALRKITDPADLPDLSAGLADLAGLREAAARSLSYLQKPSAQRFFPVSGISHARALRSIELLCQLLDRDQDPLALAAELRARFDVYTTIGCDDRGTVLFTGYYTPVFEASRERTARFRYPLHRPPENHAKDPISGETLGLRRPDGSIDPRYPTREELLSSPLLDGRELVYLDSPFAAYIVGVQGSAILRLQDGARLEVGYAGTNGKPYASLGRALVKAGKLRPEELNLKKMLDYFEAHPEDFEPLAAENQRYVFFQESSGGPYGCLNERVSRLRSIATDKTIFPRGSLCFLTARLPVSQGVYRGFALDQDAGGAIRAPGRCDVFMGVGKQAGREAGRTLAEGRLYYLIAKDEDQLAWGGE
ncbi:MAG: MltA domain-containing protein [Planctomycetota bacterium]